jgi:hypothetical protein
MESINKDDSLWMSGKIDHFIAVAEHDFDAENNDELSFKRSQKIIIAPKGRLYLLFLNIHKFFLFKKNINQK